MEGVGDKIGQEGHSSEGFGDGWLGSRLGGGRYKRS